MSQQTFLNVTSTSTPVWLPRCMCVRGVSVRFGSVMPLTHFGPSAQPDEGLNV